MRFQGRRNIDCQSGMFGFPAVSHCRLLVILVFSFGRNKPNKLLFTHSGLMHGLFTRPSASSWRVLPQRSHIKPHPLGQYVPNIPTNVLAITRLQPSDHAAFSALRISMVIHPQFQLYIVPKNSKNHSEQPPRHHRPAILRPTSSSTRH